MRKLLQVVVACVVFASSALAADTVKAPYKGKVFLGLGTRKVKLEPDARTKSTYGLLVTRVAAVSAAEKAGLHLGDIIVSIDGQTWTSDKIRLSQSFGKAGAKSRPGDSAKFVILRADPKNPKAQRTLLEQTVVLTPYPFTASEGARYPTNGTLRPDLKSVRPAYQTLGLKLVKELGYEADTLDLLARIDRSQQFPDPHRLSMMRYVHRDPFKIEAVTREAAAPFLKKKGLGYADTGLFLSQAQGSFLLFDAMSRAPRPGAKLHLTPPFKGGDLKAHLDYIESVLKVCADLNKSAFSALDEKARRHILKHRGGMLDSFVEAHMLSYDRNLARQKASAKLIQLAQLVEQRPLFDQAREAGKLTAPAFVASLRKAVEASGKNLDAPTIASRKTPYGDILIAGRKRNRHRRDVAVIYDLGGDDVYHNNGGSSVPGKIPTAIVVDYDGDDAYESTVPFRHACGDMGVGMVVDLKGDDHYVGMRFCQGAGFMGVGVLCDEAGDDTYRTLEYGQGVGHWGAGIHIDRGGKDRFEAGNFSQGGGYFYGFGMFVNAGKDNDVYIGSRYAQGFACHQAAGAFIEMGGDDRYMTRNAVAQGLSWDEASGLFIDESGNDRYEGGGFSQGASAMNGFILFIDGGGKDTYLYTDQARAGGNKYHGGKSLSLFFDLGGDDDVYPKKPNNAIVKGGANSVFMDLPGDLKDALKNDAWRKLVK